MVDYEREEDPLSARIEEGLVGLLHPLTRLSMTLPILQPIIRVLVTYFHVYGRVRGDLERVITEQTALNLQARKEMAKAKKAGETFDPDNFKLSDGRVFKRNMLDAFIDNYIEGKVTTREYMNTSIFFVLAGVKTAADVITQLFYYLSTYRTVQEKLRESILMNGVDSKYLDWFINEVLRLGPPIVAGGPRRASRDIVVKDGVVPKDSVIFAPAYVVHRLPEYWGEDADQFKPERWEHTEKIHPAQYIPFGAGIRACPGKEFVLLLMRKVLVALLTRFKFDRCSRTSDTPLFETPFFLMRKPEVATYLKISKLD